MVFELAAVLLVTVLTFIWGVRVAQAERGYAAIGGEYFLPLIPLVYYSGKRTILDWVTEIRSLWREGCA